ncbi:PTS system mannose/fructose/N-acetylgalactosamine-transporter subunit IIB [Clostridium beijerinckii]|uniref:PTS system mannose-specific IIB component n=1 Tax=Clostridium beijerinckii TaxID=1520 RepID=A0AAX0ATG1_CLOBE|nr:PTS sugar transporter subunit IIB [Clostridium beijerinckii]MBA8933875.1 PTS system mannose-specific IIB component [Clostridium beijerinckii]NRT36213.1 PTS system mannose-specific IIB component [Clostridium beijerinckii]NRT44360.1 PTS system mannose-specific IIB component [Clostridium beijerinckii]NRT86372.1 PTS system mannose-specific IIB component [Clostridium beijerinckii]NRU38069.1 PTS system mannose-specific IIB component [Clostridium beijerinckii]
MISMIRIDDRLIHGQVAVMWSKQLGVSRILVASDKIAANDMQVNALKMAAPAGIKAFVLPIQKAADLINDPRAASMKILVLSNNPKDIYEVLQKINEKPLLNLANYGRIGGEPLSEKQKLTETVYVTNEDKEIFNKIFNMGYDFEYQPLPSDAKQSLKELLGGK